MRHLNYHVFTLSITTLLRETCPIHWGRLSTDTEVLDDISQPFSTVRLPSSSSMTMLWHSGVMVVVKGRDRESDLYRQCRYIIEWILKPSWIRKSLICVILQQSFCFWISNSFCATGWLLREELPHFLFESVRVRGSVSWYLKVFLWICNLGYLPLIVASTWLSIQLLVSNGIRSGVVLILI